MKTLYKLTLLFLPLFVLFAVHPVEGTIAQQEFPTPTPTYDPLVETPLPANPTEYELGQNLYWHWCMTCHGDRGQGLTDEFRGIWVSDHQNCWGRGCHAGHPGDQGFPIPTVVPPLVTELHLAQFTSVQRLSDYLESTHPPQSPGILTDDEYHAIALFVFTMNERSLIEIPVTNTPVATFVPTSTAMPVKESKTERFPIYVMVILIVLVIGVLALAGKTGLQE